MVRKSKGRLRSAYLLVGLIALCVGILVAIPVGIAALAAAYEDLFGHTVPRTV